MHKTTNRCLSLLVAASLLAVLGLGCNRAPEGAAPDGKMTVGVGILPLAYMAERIGGEHVNVQALVGTGQDPHTYEPMPRQIAELAKARVYFTIQLPLEKRLVQKIVSTNKNLKIVDVRRGIPLRMMTQEEAAHEEHEGHKAEHGDNEHDAHADEEGEPDPHVWLNPRYAVVLSRNICEAMAQADPAHAADYTRNLESLVAELVSLDAEIAQALAPHKGREFMVFHPAFGYFADAYGLKQLPVEVEGKEPGPRQLSEMIKLAKERGIRIIFIEPQFSDKSARAIADAIGGAVVTMDDLAYDYISNLRDMAAKVSRAVQKEKPQ